MVKHAFQFPNGDQQSEAHHRSAEEVFPGGVSHNIRYFAPFPIYVDGADGGVIQDVDGNTYVDFWMNHITSVLGHAHPDVVAAVTEQANRGLHYGAPNEPALELGRKVKEYIPSAERVRFCASGTEATMYASRLARSNADKPHILKAEGGWHGGNTDLSKAIHTPFDVPTTDGLPPGAADHVHAFPVNDRAAVTTLLDQYEVGGVIIEPMLLAGGGVVADEAFLQFLADERDARGFNLIFDEVVTGLKVSPGSFQSRIGISPDLTTLGKSLGGGMPVGAVAGRAKLFESARPDYDGPEPTLAGGGTFSMNPMTAVAGNATIDVIESEPVFEYTESKGQYIRDSLSAIFEDVGVSATVLGTSSLFLPHFDPEGRIQTVGDVETKTDRTALHTFHRRLIEEGFYFLPGHMGLVTYQTTENQIEDFLRAAEEVTREMVREGEL